MYKNTARTNFIDVTSAANLGGENAVAGPATTFDYNNEAF